MKKFFVLPLLALAGFTPALADDEAVLDLTKKDGFERCQQISLKYDHDGIDVWTFSNYSGTYMYNYQITNGYYDDYLLTPELDLRAGTMYAVQMTPSAYNTSDAGKSWIEVSLGQGATTQVGDFKVLKKITKLPYATFSEPATSYEVAFAVPEDGKYRVAFHAGPSPIYLKNAKIVSQGQSAVPAAPGDFAVTPDPDGELSVTVSFTVPGTTITGQPLESVAYNLYRGVQKIKKAIDATPGEKVVFTETRGESGMATYGVEIVAGEEVSEKITASAFIGVDTPNAPSDLTLTIDGNNYTVSWSAPTQGSHATTLSPEKLSYNVWRVLDGIETQIAAERASTALSEEIITTGLQSLSYKVQAVYGSKKTKSDIAETPVTRIGRISLPFGDSFSNGTLSPLWDNAIITTTVSAGTIPTTYYWQAKTPGEGRLQTQGIPAFDDDNGALLYNAFNIQRNNSCRLSTPAIAYIQGENPMLTFAKYNLASGTNDTLYVQISNNYGPWVDIAKFTPKGEPEKQWVVNSFSLNDFIPADTPSYRIGFYAVSAYGHDLVIDAVRIFNSVANDLEISSLTVPESIVAGNSVNLEVKVTNNGSSAVGAEDYALSLLTSFPDEVELPVMEAIEPMKSKIYCISIPTNSLHVHQGGDFDFTVSLSYDADMIADNNISETKTVGIGYGVGNSASHLAVSYAQPTAPRLSWTPAKDLAYEAVAVEESFEDASWPGDFYGPYNGWTAIDIDGKAGSTWYSASGSRFRLCKNAANYPKDKDGDNVLGVTVAGKAQQDDWLVSPKLACKATSTMTLNFLMAVKQPMTSSSSSSTGDYAVELLYTTAETFDAINPAESFTQKAGQTIRSTSGTDSRLPHDGYMHPLSFEDIPGQATYIALHFISKGNYDIAMWVDNLSLSEYDANSLMGYHVYEVGFGRVNDELLSADATSFDIPAVEVQPSAAQKRQMFVTAVYPDGEARPSNIVEINPEVSEIKEPAAPEQQIFYNLQGQRVKNPARGLYLTPDGKVIR